ncbi:MAG: hypothetical protein AB1705_15695 [Verrucomicrobiota bacterium]
MSTFAHAGWLGAAAALCAVAGAPAQPANTPEWVPPPASFQFADFLLVPLRIHLLSASNAPALHTTLGEKDFARIVPKMNRVWAQAGIHFQVESLRREEAVNQDVTRQSENAENYRWLLRTRPVASRATNAFDLYYIKRFRSNGVYLRDEPEETRGDAKGGNDGQGDATAKAKRSDGIDLPRSAIFVKDTASLKPTDDGIDEPLPRVSSHELGHAFGLGHRQDVTNLMASGTTGVWLNEREIRTSRRVAGRFDWIRRAAGRHGRSGRLVCAQEIRGSARVVSIDCVNPDKLSRSEARETTGGIEVEMKSCETRMPRKVRSPAFRRLGADTPKCAEIFRTLQMITPNRLKPGLQAGAAVARLSVLTALALSFCAFSALAGETKPIPAGAAQIEVEVNGLKLDAFTYRPANYKDGPLIVVFHGMNRNADDYRDNAKGMGDRFAALIVAPRFDTNRFPVPKYQHGGVMLGGKLQPQEEWTYSLIPKFIEEVRRREGRPDMPYYFIGHSAGGQFLTRLAGFSPTGAKRIVAANPGTQLFPTTELKFPYGFGEVPEPAGGDEGLKRYLAQPLTLYLGTADTGSKDLDRTETAMKQGATRIERGRNCFLRAQELAKQRGWPCNWSIVEAPELGHDSKKMFDHANCEKALFTGECVTGPMSRQELLRQMLRKDK